MNCDFIINFLTFILAIIIPLFLILHIYKYIISGKSRCEERFDFDIIHPASLSSNSYL
jgi:hypothetical protein